MKSAFGDVLSWLCSPDTELPLAVELQARWLLMDTLGCVMAGRQAPPVQKFEALLGKSDPGSFRLLDGPGLSNAGAAWMLGMAACWDEACEGHAGAHGRPGVAALAALLPLSPGLSMGQFLSAFVVGYEVGARAGANLRIKPGMHVDGNWPALGAAAAVAHALGLGLDGIEQAVHIAACQLPLSLYLPIRSGDTARNTFLGHAAALGQSAAFAAASGISAPANSIGEYARVGLNREGAEFDRSHRFHILDAYFKPYAAVRHVHYGALAAFKLKPEVDLESITSISLRVYEEATVYCANRAPQTPLQAQFSLSFGVAAMLRWGRLDPSLYRDPQFQDPLMRKLEGLVEVGVDAELTHAAQRRATLTIASGDTTVQEHVSAVDGDAGMPFTQAALIEKFVFYCAACPLQPRALATADLILHLPRGEKFETLWGVTPSIDSGHART